MAYYPWSQCSFSCLQLTVGSGSGIKCLYVLWFPPKATLPAVLLHEEDLGRPHRKTKIWWIWMEKKIIIISMQCFEKRKMLVFFRVRCTEILLQWYFGFLKYCTNLKIWEFPYFNVLWFTCFVWNCHFTLWKQRTTTNPRPMYVLNAS